MGTGRKFVILQYLLVAAQCSLDEEKRLLGPSANDPTAPVNVQGKKRVLLKAFLLQEGCLDR